ncbi:hypothetical protein niasHT_018003 [Heterodera trifolii]|uniref:Peptidase S1 domain-containing protein n=1 Tax=Heterodera trifolii TaxID=157864 RepID=A0ABD2LBR6_9BILA
MLAPSVLIFLLFGLSFSIKAEKKKEGIIVTSHPSQMPKNEPYKCFGDTTSNTALAPSLVSIASPTTDNSNSGTWLSSVFDVGIIILLFLILILVAIVLCLLCRLFYRSRQQQFVPSNIVPSPTVSSPRMPSANVPLPITTSVPMLSSSAADHSAQSQIPIQTLVSLQHQCGANPMPKCCSSSSYHSPCPIPIQILAPSLRHNKHQFLPSPSMPYADDHHRPQVIVPSCSASPFHDHLGPSPIDFSECGISDFDPLLDNVPKMEIGTYNIYMGQAVKNDNSLPWMASLIKGGKFSCSATIIGPNHILTAMHCVKSSDFDIEEAQISYGRVHVSSQPHKSAIDSVQLQRKAKFYQIYDNFGDKMPKATLLLHDIAIIKLKKTIEFAPNVRPICLFGLGGDFESSSDEKFLENNSKIKNSQFIIAGWGLTWPQCAKDQNRTRNDQLNYGKTRMISRQKCREMSKKEKNSIEWSAGDDDAIKSIESLLNEFETYGLDNNICVVPEPSIGEPGDSGSPLMLKIGSNKWLHVGVATKTSCNDKDPTSTEGLVAQYTPIDCAWIANATNGEVKCIGW